MQVSEAEGCLRSFTNISSTYEHIRRQNAERKHASKKKRMLNQACSVSAAVSPCAWAHRDPLLLKPQDASSTPRQQSFLTQGLTTPALRKGMPLTVTFPICHIAFYASTVCRVASSPHCKMLPFQEYALLPELHVSKKHF